ncbi:cell wall surface anchored protein [Rhodotorula toruloides]|uniref:Cell wall surface anchored protein n=1 Tax=Rhodotorula toruloides TaxID=5286 RepID=A0A511KLF1_RHOTO|nr:cell wall surface anchored protein [Rhodotorula toruloides]
MTDYLTKLPTELFLDICQRVQDAEQGPYLGAVSNADRAVAIASIETLYLELKGEPDDGTPCATDLTNLFFRLESVESLHVVGSPSSSMVTLRGPILDNPAVRDFLCWLRRPRMLVMYDLTRGHSEDSLASLLANVQEPEEVRSLGLLRLSGPIEQLGGTLECFSNLLAIKFRAGGFSSGCIADLGRMEKLKHIDFVYGAKLTIEDLASLISGPCKPPQLDAVALVLVWDNYADLAAQYGGDPLDYARECEMDGLPRYSGWTDDFTLEGLADLVETADKECIKLTGLAVKLAREELTCRKRLRELEEARKKRRAAAKEAATRAQLEAV